MLFFGLGGETETAQKKKRERHTSCLSPGSLLLQPLSRGHKGLQVQLTQLTCAGIQLASASETRTYGLQRTAQSSIVQDFLPVSCVAPWSEGGCLSAGLQPSGSAHRYGARTKPGPVGHEGRDLDRDTNVIGECTCLWGCA